MGSPDITELDGMHFDVAIVGAGINGASTAQQLSAAGYRVLVVDQGDFANGATSRSSRLLHCGLRHLASGSGVFQSLLNPASLWRSLRTVHADMIARDELVETIPERVRPINICLPVYADDAYQPWHMDLAFSALRMMSPGGVPLDYQRYRPTQTRGRVPVQAWLRDPARLRSIVVFREYLFDWPERIALDALFDARRMGARIHNYTRVDALQKPGADGHWRLSLSGMEHGEDSCQSPPGASAEVSAAMVLNLAGAWIDATAGKAGVTIKPKCTGIKGIHIALQLPREFSDWGIFAYNSIGEPLYCMPMNGMHYIGITRTVFDGDIAAVCATDEEIDWIISEANRCLPQIGITRADILFSWAGVNPLTHDPDHPLGSREIKIHDLADDGLPGMLALTGGAISTHRRIANRLLSAVSSRLAPSTAAQEPKYRWPESTSEENAPRIETEAFSISTATILRCARDEQPRSLADLLMRRLGAGWTSDQGLALARPVAESVAAELGWSDERIDAEVRDYAQHLETARRRPPVSQA